MDRGMIVRLGLDIVKFGYLYVLNVQLKVIILNYVVSVLFVEYGVIVMYFLEFAFKVRVIGIRLIKGN